MVLTRPVTRTKISTVDFGWPVYDWLMLMPVGAWNAYTSTGNSMPSETVTQSPLANWVALVPARGTSISGTAIRVDTAGVYLINAACRWASSTVGTVRAMGVQANGTNISTGGGLNLASPPAPTSGLGMGLAGSTMVRFSAGTLLTVVTRHDAGSTLTCDGTLILQRIAA